MTLVEFAQRIVVAHHHGQLGRFLHALVDQSRQRSAMQQFGLNLRLEPLVNLYFYRMGRHRPFGPRFHWSVVFPIADI